jgi:hypothetical protein
MNYRELLYNKYKGLMQPIVIENSTYYLHKGFKFERIKRSEADVYNIWNTCTYNGFYVNINSEMILRAMYHAKDLAGWGSRLRSMDNADTPEKYIEALQSVIGGKVKAVKFCPNCGEKVG